MKFGWLFGALFCTLALVGLKANAFDDKAPLLIVNSSLTIAETEIKNYAFKSVAGDFNQTEKRDVVKVTTMAKKKDAFLPLVRASLKLERADRKAIEIRVREDKDTVVVIHGATPVGLEFGEITIGKPFEFTAAFVIDSYERVKEPLETKN